MEKVIFDTNKLRSTKSLTHFFGNREELERFQNVAEIIIPDLVLEEIKIQKKKHFEEEKLKLMENSCAELINAEELLEKLNINALVLEVFGAETIRYTTISITETSCLEQMKHLALHNQAPFDLSSDRGFKDAYILFTIQEYLKSITDEMVFIATCDSRLAEALSKHPKVKIIGDFRDFELNRATFFSEPYFLESLSVYLEQSVTAGNLLRVGFNPKSNWLVEVAVEDEFFGELNYLVEVDYVSKEILGKYTGRLSKHVHAFKTSGSFAETKTHISALRSNVSYLFLREAIEMLEVSLDNNQIYWIAEDSPVRGFIRTLFEKCSSKLEDNLKVRIASHYKITL